MNATPAERFGKDHWALLAYVETCCVDGRGGVGALDRRRMRCNEGRHPMLTGAYAENCHWKPGYGTRLAGFFEFVQRDEPETASAAGLQLLDHDDWDCLDDLADAGLVDIISTVNGFAKITAEGRAVAAQLREHKAQGGHFASFRKA